jgi:hypothetical protein
MSSGQPSPNLRIRLLPFFSPLSDRRPDSATGEPYNIRAEELECCAVGENDMNSGTCRAACA